MNSMIRRYCSQPVSDVIPVNSELCSLEVISSGSELKVIVTNAPDFIVLLT